MDLWIVFNVHLKYIFLFYFNYFSKSIVPLFKMKEYLVLIRELGCCYPNCCWACSEILILVLFYEKYFLSSEQRISVSYSYRYFSVETQSVQR